MALNSVHGSSLSSASAGVLTTSRLPPPPLPSKQRPRRSGSESYEDPYHQNNHQRQPGRREFRQRTAGVAEYPQRQLQEPGSTSSWWTALLIRPHPPSRLRQRMDSASRLRRLPVNNSRPAPGHPAVSYRTFP